MKRILILLLPLICLVSSCSIKKATYRDIVSRADVPDKIAILDVSVFDGMNKELLTHQDVFIEKRTILWIGPTGTPPKDAHVIDGKGLTLMPGLIDAHVHLTGSAGVPWKQVRPDAERAMEAFVYGGVTTVYDMGGFAKKSKKMRDKAAAEKLIGPQIFFTHSPITVPGGHPIPTIKAILPKPLGSIAANTVLTIEKPDDAEKIVQKLLKLDCDYVKIIVDQIPLDAPEMSEELLTALVEAGHRNELKVFVHIGDRENALAAARAKADVLAHTIYRDGLTAGEAKQIADAGMTLVATQSSFANVASFCSGEFEPTDMEKASSPPEVLEPVTGEGGKQFCSHEHLGEFANSIADNQKNWKNNIELLSAAGVPILAGTDSPIAGGYPGAGLHRELRALTEMGLSNYEALVGATSGSASLFLDNPDFGKVQIGCRADLLLIKGNPLEDISATENIEMVILNGAIIDRKEP